MPSASRSQQLVGRQIDELDLVGAGEHAIGHGLAHVDAGDLRDDIVQAFEVLHVDGRVDVDARGDQLVDILPALGMARARMVRVRELIDDEQLRLPGQCAIEIEFRQRDAAMLEVHRRQDFQTFEQCLGFGTTVQLDIADHDIDTVGALATRGFEHRVALADAGGGAEENAQAPAPRARFVVLHAREQSVRIGAMVGIGGSHESAAASGRSLCSRSRTSARIAKTRPLQPP